MNKLVLVVSLLMICSSSFAEIYKWTDSQGNVHFSDTPHPGAEQIKLPKSQTYSPPAPKPQSDSNEEGNDNSESRVSGDSESAENGDPQSHADFYTRLEIIKPSSEGTIWSNEGIVDVAVGVEPGLLQKDSLRIVFDGQPLGPPQRNQSFQLRGINRGAHTLAVQVLSPSEEVVKTSSDITFYLQKARVNMIPKGKASN